MSVDKVSIVIRTMNEKPELAAWLDFFKKHPFEGELEIIVADNDSTDGTVKLAKQEGCRVITIPKNEFSYPRQLNDGIAAATSDLVVVVVAHAYPLFEDWLQMGLSHFSNSKVVGVYAANFPGRNATLIELLFYGFGYIAEKVKGVRVINKTSMGVFGATNIIIRRSVWQEHPFDESYGSGGEDYHWAKWAISKGYLFVSDPKFSVRHSHGLGLFTFLKQYRHWLEIMSIPSPFDRGSIQYKKHLRFDKQK